MKLFRGAVDTIKRVYRYEKTTGMDVGALQGVMLIFAVVLFLIDIENFRLGKYVIGIVTLVVGIVSVTAVFVIRRFQKVVLVCRIAVFLFLLLAAAILYAGANDVFSLLWYLLLPVITLVPLGMPFGAPVCIGFGLWIMAFFWTPLADILRYDYPRDYRVFYPIFYWGFCLMVVAMDIFYKNYQIRQQQNEENLENEVQEAVAGTKNLMIHSVTAISQLIDAKDRYTREHSQRVAEYSRLIADYMKGGHATGEELELIYRSGLLHDIGKIAVPDAVLNKPERLTDEEWEIMKEHPAIGAEILSKSSMLSGLIDIVFHHHERFDGKGYPDGLKGAEISVGARIIAICDSIDAMTSTRRYRKALGFDICYQEIEKNLGKMYDPVIGRFVLDNWDKVITVLQKDENSPEVLIQ